MGRPKKQVRKKRPDGTYEAKVTIGRDIHGKVLRKSFYSSKSFEAAKLKGERWKIENEMNIKRSEPERTGDMTFEELCREVQEIKRSTVREDTYESSYLTIVEKHLIPFFGDWKIRKIRRVDIEKYFISKKEMAKTTLESHKSVLRAIFNHAVMNSYLYVNPADRMTIDVGKKAKEKKILTLEETNKVMRYVAEHPTHITIAIYLMLGFGLGRAEVLGIKKQDIDAENKLIHICRDVVCAQGNVIVHETKNKYRNRYVVVSQEAIDLLVNDPMFDEKEFLISPYGEPMNPKSFNYHFQKVFKENSLPIITPHGCRHTRATIWLCERKPAEAIAKQFGWSGTDMIYKHYGHLSNEDMREMLEID